MPDKPAASAFPGSLDFLGTNAPSQTEAKPDAKAADASEESPHLGRFVDDFELSDRTAKCLQDAEILYIRDLVQKTEADLLKLKRFKPECLDEIKEILAEMDLTLRRD